MFNVLKCRHRRVVQLPESMHALGALRQLNLAIEKSEGDPKATERRKGVTIDIAYRYMRARLLQNGERWAEAGQDWEKVWEHRSSLPDYQQALVAMYSTYNAIQPNSGAKGLDLKSRILFALNTFKAHSTIVKHSDLTHKLELLESINAGEAGLSLPKLDFDIVE